MRSCCFLFLLLSFIFYTPNYSLADSNSASSSVIIDNETKIPYREKLKSFKENIDKYQDAIEEL